MAEQKFFKELGVGVASLSFGVALSIFIYAIASGIVNGIQAGLLYATSFLLMMRFWWKYTEIFVHHMPSHSFWHFLLDFLISFFGILAVLFVGNIQTWALLGAATMGASAVRCCLSWRESKGMLRRTFWNSIVMLVIMGGIYFFSSIFDQMFLAAGIFILVALFVLIFGKKH